MTEKQPVRSGILPTDIDPQGNVTLWDRGPREFVPLDHESDETKAARARQHADELRAWQEQNGDGPVAAIMHSSDASHGLMTDPERYSLEPYDLDEGEVERRMKEMKDKRELARDAAQIAIDRRTAIAAIVSDAAQKKLIESPQAVQERRAQGVTPDHRYDYPGARPPGSAIDPNPSRPIVQPGNPNVPPARSIFKQPDDKTPVPHGPIPDGVIAERDAEAKRREAQREAADRGKVT